MEMYGEFVRAGSYAMAFGFSLCYRKECTRRNV